MKSPADIAAELGEARAISDGETQYAGLTDNTRKIIRVAATIAAQRQVSSVLEVVSTMHEQSDPGDDYARGFKAALSSLRSQIVDVVYPWQVIATTGKNDPVAIIDHAFTRFEAQQIADRWNRSNGSVAKYTVEEA